MLIRLGTILLAAYLAVLPAFGQEARGEDMKDRVLDRLFRPNITSPYVWKITLRFGDSDSQIVIVTHPVYPVHPRGQAELITYNINGLGGATLSQFITKIAAEHPKITDQEIAAKLKPIVKRSRINYDALRALTDELKVLRISPMLATRVAVDEFSDYEFWYDSGQESVHYKLTGPFEGDPQDALVQWMVKFRTSIPKLLATPTK